jgi:uracil-DNA glycosylase
MWLIYASEVAACIGENKYKKKWESFQSVFKRIDDGIYYKSALSRLEKMGFKTVSEEEKIRDIIKETGIDNCVQDLLNSNIENSVQLNDKIFDFESKLEGKEITLKEQKNHLKKSLCEKSNILEHVEKEITKLNESLHNVVENRILCEEIQGVDNDSFKKLEDKESKILKLIQEKQQKQIELSNQLFDETTNLKKHEEQWNDFKNMKKNIISQKQTLYGKTKEESIISSQILGQVSENNSQFYKKCIDDNVIVGGGKISWGIGGRIDGFRDGVLIEIKNRKSRIFNPLPVYDYIQIQTYMQLLNVRNATVIQCLTTEDNKVESKELNFTRDDKFWDANILHELKIFVYSLANFVQDSLLQDKFFQTPDTKKSYIITSLFNKIKKEHNLVDKNMSHYHNQDVERSAYHNQDVERSAYHNQDVERSLKKAKLIKMINIDNSLKKKEKNDDQNSNISPPSIFDNFDELCKKPPSNNKDHVLPECVLSVDDKTPSPCISSVSTQLFPTPFCFFEPPNDLPRQKIDWSVGIGSQIPKDWKVLIGDDLNKDYFKKIETFVDQEYKQFIIYPPRELIFESLNNCSFENTKVVILGLDPYINPGEAHGLAFSVPKGTKFPKTLKNIFTELQSEMKIPFPSSGDLTPWAKQGVLLLNIYLTVRASKTESHSKCGWNIFTDCIISKLSKFKEHLIFVLWGKISQGKEHLIDKTKHTVLKTSHPSPLAYEKGFKGCNHFTMINEDLVSRGVQTINWRL